MAMVVKATESAIVLVGERGISSMKKIRESVIQRAVLDYLAWYGKSHKIYAFRSGAGMVKTEAGGVFRSGKPGVPDITVCQNGFIGLEIKTAKGRQSATQKEAEAEIVAAGGVYRVIRNLGELKELFPMDKA